MRKVLVTGMSGTGKSSALAALEQRGFAVVDTDEGGWTVWSDAERGYVWREERIAALLACEDGPALFVSGTVSNQGRFYPQFDAVVLLSAPAEVLLGRIEGRTTHDYGKSRDERDLILQHLAAVEPLLRATCTHEIDASQALELVVEQLAAIGEAEARPMPETFHHGSEIRAQEIALHQKFLTLQSQLEAASEEGDERELRRLRPLVERARKRWLDANKRVARGDY